MDFKGKSLLLLIIFCRLKFSTFIFWEKKKNDKLPLWFKVRYLVALMFKLYEMRNIKYEQCGACLNVNKFAKAFP